MLVRPSLPFVNKSTRNDVDSFSPIIPSEFYHNRSILQATINPYELVSSTLHNNEFSPSASMFDLMRRNELSANVSRGTIALPNRHDSSRFNILGFPFPSQSTDIEITKSKSPCMRPPPPPALESLPMSVKSISNKILNSETGMYLWDNFWNINMNTCMYIINR